MKVGDEQAGALRAFLRAGLVVTGALMAIFAAILTSQVPHAVSIGLGVAIVGCTAAALAVKDSLLGLRTIEVVLFGAMAGLVTVTGYDTIANAADPASAWRGTVIFSCILTVAYGVAVPNKALRAAPMLIAIAGLPFVSYAMVAQPAAESIASAGLAGPATGAGIAVVVSMAAVMLTGMLRDMAVTSRSNDMYELIEQIGLGGMGEIWRAEHSRLARQAAIKIIRPDKLCADPARAQTLISRFEREAKATANLRSPNTVEIYDFGTTSNGVFYYAMEYLDGMDLQRLVVEHGPLRAGRAVYLLCQICDSLAEAHDTGLVHRDIKPGNIYVSHLGRSYDYIKVLDFGLAKPSNSDDSDAVLSAENEITGTPTFMAPEMVTGDKRVDGRADIYAIGCVAYWMLTGKLVFEEDTAMAQAAAHAAKPPVPPSERTDNEIPQELEAIVMRCLEKKPEDRFQDCPTLARAIRDANISGWNRDAAEIWWQQLASA